MSHQFISDLREGSSLTQFFLIRQIESRKDKSGKPFLSLKLGDKSGIIVARVWSDVLKKYPGPFVVGDFVGVKGEVGAYQGEPQIIIKYLESTQNIEARGGDLSAFDPDLLIQATPYDRQQLWRELLALAETQIQEPLRGLVLSLLGQNQEALLVCPAARLYHHPYLGGLLEHTWSVTRHALASLEIYPALHRDLTLAGAILHDLGKVKELGHPQAPAITLPGQLLGHIVLGWEMVRAAARDFPEPTLLLQLEHIILSHHGAVEFGSPVPPKTREAMLVYFLDDLDAKLKMMDQHLEADAGDGDFTSYHRVLQRGLYKGPDRRLPESEPEK